MKKNCLIISSRIKNAAHFINLFLIFTAQIFFCSYFFSLIFLNINFFVFYFHRNLILSLSAKISMLPLWKLDYLWFNFHFVQKLKSIDCRGGVTNHKEKNTRWNTCMCVLANSRYFVLFLCWRDRERKTYFLFFFC